MVDVKGTRLIRSTGEWQILLGVLALPGVFVGAWLCNRIGRRNTSAFERYDLFVVYAHRD